MHVRISEYRWLISLAGLFLLTAFAKAQIYEIGGGTSTIFQSQGITASMRAKNYAVSLGAGRVDGEFGAGGAFEYFKGPTIYSAGDGNMTFQLPTDIFMPGRMIFMTGIGAETTKGTLHAQAFGGMISNFFISPLFTGAQPQKPAAAAILTETVGKNNNLRLTEMALFSAHSSLMEGAEWTPAPNMVFGISGGLSNLLHNPYGAVSAKIKERKLTLQAQYVWYKGDTSLLNVPTYQFAEPVKENLHLQYRLPHHIVLSGGRSNYLNFSSTNVDASEVGSASTSNHATVSFRILNVGLSASGFQSNYMGRQNFGESYSASRNITKWINAGVTYSQSAAHGSPTQKTKVVYVTERIGPQWFVTETYSNSNGRSMLNFGGQYFNNRFGGEVRYVTMYVPTNIDNPFQSGYAASGWMNLYRFRVSYTQNFDPYGKPTYTVQANWLSYGQPDDILGPGKIHVGDYAVRGQVIDENGTPVEGMALLIDKKPIYTDADGRFEISENKRSSHSLSVTPSMATTIHAYEVRSAPSKVESVTGDNPGVTIIVKQLQKLRGMM